MWRRLDRYVVSEIAGPLALGFLVYTFILLVSFFFRLADFIIKRGLGLRSVGELLFAYLPSIVVLTLPMSLLLGVLLGIGRLASDSELIALRASGTSLYRILRPVMLISLLLAAFNTYLMLELLPRGNLAFARLMAENATRTLSSAIEPRIFYNEFQGKILYVSDSSPVDREWKGILLADSVTTSDRPSDVIVAERGRLELADGGERVLLILEDAVQHTFDLARPDRYETRKYERMQMVLRDQFATEQRQQALGIKHVRAMTWEELRTAERDPTSSAQLRSSAAVQRQKMFSIPVACVVFGLLGLPLAFTNRRGGKSSGFALSIGIVMAYHVLLKNGEKAADAGETAPWLAIWLPNLVLALLGAFLLVMRDRDRSLLPRAVESGRAWSALQSRFARLAKGWRRRFGWRAARSARPAPALRAGSARFLLRLPRFRLRFPNIVDRYVLRRYAFILILVFVSGISLLVITDLTEIFDELLTHHPPTAVVLRYYQYLSLQLAYDIAPIVVLVTTLVTFSLLSRTNELIACRALGISIYRLALPAFVAAILVGGCFAFFEAEILPASNQKVADARAVIKGGQPLRLTRSADRQWQVGGGRFVYNFLHFDDRRTALQRLQVFEFDEKFRLVKRLFAEEARHSESGWSVSQGWTRRFAGREQLSYRPIKGKASIDLPELPSFFTEEVRRPAQMTYLELAAYARELREGGRPQPQYEVALHSKIAFPVGAVVMAMVGFPFAFRIERRGALYGLGVSIALGVAFVLVFAFFKTLGEVGALPAAIAVWSPGVLFALFGGYLLLGVRT